MYVALQNECVEYLILLPNNTKASSITYKPYTPAITELYQSINAILIVVQQTYLGFEISQIVLTTKTKTEFKKAGDDTDGSHLHPDVLLDSPDLKRHSAKVMRVIHKAVEALEGDSKSLYEELALLGAKHAAIKNMKIEYFKIIKEAILMTWGRLIYEEFTDDVRRAWAHVLDEVVGIMGVGCLLFEEEEEKMLEEEENIHNLVPISNDYQQFHKRQGKTSRLSVATVSKEELDQIYPNCK
ncbi:Neuroglobin [Schistosoma japonicum]|nr:Neuroglobin [Schistosoma japonicum]